MLSILTTDILIYMQRERKKERDEPGVNFFNDLFIF
jgi:hypothetical protein